MQNLLLSNSSNEESEVGADILATANHEDTNPIMRTGGDIAADICAKLAALRASSERPVDTPALLTCFQPPQTMHTGNGLQGFIHGPRNLN
jgi:hypothetical protein